MTDGSLLGLALLANAVFFIPQAFKLWRSKTTQGVSLIMFVGFWLIQLIIAHHGFARNDTVLAVGYLLSMSTCGTVIGVIVYLRLKQGGDLEAIPLESIMAQLPGHLCWKNKDGVLLGSNMHYWQALGCDALSGAIGKTEYAFFSQEEANEISRVDREVMRTDKSQQVELTLISPDGTTHCWLL
jgi:MtN3 and saliva related transmembrane protein